VKGTKVLYNPAAIARRVRAIAQQISRDFRGQTVDVVGLVDNGYIFLADLVRYLELPVRIHFIRTVMRDVVDPVLGKERKEISYTPEIAAEDKNILLVDGVLQSGVTTDFLLRRIGLKSPRAVKTAVLLDKSADRRVFLEPDYFAFRTASKGIVVGFGLAWNGLYGNLPYLATLNPAKGPAARPVKVGAGRKR
jgi:hypoxanthine phosphoribosyltransferase